MTWYWWEKLGEWLLGMSETGQIYPQLWQFQIWGTQFSDTSANLLVASQCRETNQWHGSFCWEAWKNVVFTLHRMTHLGSKMMVYWEVKWPQILGYCLPHFAAGQAHFSRLIAFYKGVCSSPVKLGMPVVTRFVFAPRMDRLKIRNHCEPLWLIVVNDG